MANEGRFYENEFPELEEVVVVQVQRIVDMGAYVSCLEYNGREGMMLLSELSKRRIRSVAKLLKVGRTEVVMVLRADHEKGYIDLSKRRVDPEDVKTKEEQFAKAKAVYGIMRHVAHLHNIDVNELSKKVSWPLNRKYPDAHEALRKHINEELDIWKEIDFSQPGVDLSDKAEQIKEDIEVSLRRRLVAQALRMRAKIDVSCSQFEGIDAIKEALQKGFEASTEECKVKIQLIAHPLFMLTCMTREKEVARTTLEKAMELIEESIVAKGGEFIVRTKPELVGHDDPIQEEVFESESGSEMSDQSHMGDLDPELLKQLADAKGGSDCGSDEDEE